MSITSVTNLDYLIDDLRLRIGDTDSTQYRYLTEWLRTALVGAIKALRRWWLDKYLIDDDTNNIYRNLEVRSYKFEYDQPPVLDHSDEEPVLLMAAIIILSGSLQNRSWDIGSWRDYEVSYSNLQSGKEQADLLKQFRLELRDYLKPPSKRLASARKRSLIGFRQNQYERDTSQP